MVTRGLARSNHRAANLVSGAVRVYRSVDLRLEDYDRATNYARGMRGRVPLMRIGVLRERLPGERRVALIPDGVARLTKAGHEIRIEKGAGTSAGFPDEQYEAAGGSIAADSRQAADADLVLAVRRPTDEQVAMLREGSILIALLQPSTAGELASALARRNVKGLSLEKVPRITKAQSMDVLSSQSTAAGYKAALIGASELAKFLPMLTTAAGTIAPARAFIIGAGVAGLQAIATAPPVGRHRLCVRHPAGGPRAGAEPRRDVRGVRRGRAGCGDGWWICARADRG